ncbi:unnamed protein product [Closterium sp. NIES-65]|nr:unnamed protein product [Closterium sp. NIES-65]
MQAYADAARAELKQELIGDGLAGRLSLSTDIWTSENNLAFMVVTVHRITSDFQLRQHILDFVQLEGSHTASLIAKTLEGILAEWGLTEMLFAVTTDNAENNNKAMRMLAGDPAEGAAARIEFPLFDKDRHVRCIAHVMNIAVQAALKKDEVKEALKRLRAVCAYVGWSVQRSENFARQQRILKRRDDAPVLRLICDSPTRWGSTYDMIVRALELQQALALLLMRTDVSIGGGECGVTLREQLDGLRLTDVHWDALVELKEFLEPFNSITKAAEGSLYPTAASVVPLYNQLLDKLEISFRKEGVTPLRQALISAALAKLKKYKYGENEELVIATFLDPRYKTVFFQLPKWEARNAAHVTEVGGCARSVQDVDEGTVIRLVRARLAEYQARVSSRRQAGEVTSDTGGATGPSSVTGGTLGTTGASGGGGGGFEHSIFDEMDALEAAAGGGAQDEVDRYLAEPRQRGGCPLAFWRAREDFEALREMARDYLAVPATSAASERAFSQGRNVITWQRHRLTAGRVRAVMAIKSWMEQNTSGRSLNVAGAARVLEELCYEAYLRLCHVDLARWCYSQYGLRPDRSTVGRILKSAERWAVTATVDNQVRRRGGAWPELEQAMARWIANAGPAGVPLTLQTIRNHVAAMARNMGIPPTFRCSIGWVRRALWRQGVRCRAAQGEAASADMAAVRDAREKLPQLLTHLGLSPRDTFNLDETALWLSVLPRRTYSNGRILGRKVSKVRLTVAFLVNADGSHAFRPLVISKAKRPHDFRPDYDPEALCYWRHNTKGWMTAPLNAAMYAENRHIVVLLDNTSSHMLRSEHAWSEIVCGMRTTCMSNVRLVFLPPNTTAFTQPLDQGIIATAKARYRQHLLRAFSALWNADGATSAVARYRPNLRDLDDDIDDVGTLISELGLGTGAMTAAEYVTIDDGEPTCAEGAAGQPTTEPEAGMVVELWEAPTTMQAVYDDADRVGREARRTARAACEMLIGYARATCITPRDLCHLFNIRNPIIIARMERASPSFNLNVAPQPVPTPGADPTPETPRPRGRVLPGWMTQPSRRQQLLDAGVGAVMDGLRKCERE